MSSTVPQPLAVIDDDPTVPLMLRGILDRRRYKVHSAYTASAGLDLVRSRRPLAVILDAVLPDAYGADVLRQIAEIDAGVPVLFVQTRTSGPATIEAAKYGAFDFLTKPLDPDQVRAVVARACQFRQRRIDQRSEDQSDPSCEHEPRDLAGSCAAMLEIFTAIGRFANSHAPVLIVGEPGVGKEAIAQQIHKHGSAGRGPFLTLHCPAYSEDRLQELFFGDSKAAEGLWEQAAGGLLMLQEARSLPLSVQAELLARLEEQNGAGRLERLTRVVVSDSVGLDEAVQEGSFRSDLYFLLAACSIYVPPLRQRLEDLEELVDALVRRTMEFGGDGEAPQITPEAFKLLRRQSWSGNLDELQGAIRRAVLSAPHSVIDAETMQSALRVKVGPPQSPTGGADDERFFTNWRRFVDERLKTGAGTLHSECLAEAERKVLARLMQHTGGNKAQASRLLGISRASLRKKIEALGVQLPEKTKLAAK